MSAYADLEIKLFKRDDDRYTVELDFSQVGSDTEARLLGDEPTYLDLNLEKLDGLIYSSEEYAIELSKSFWVGELHNAFDIACARASALSAALRIRLSIERRATALHGLHWEKLHDPQSGKPLLTNENHVFSRYLSSSDMRPIDMRPLHDLKALVVIANPKSLNKWKPGGGPPLTAIDVKGELARACAGLGGITVEEASKKIEALSGQGFWKGAAQLCLGGITVETLCSDPDMPGNAALINIANKLRDGYDILYLVCHGSLTGEEPILFLEDTTGDVKKEKGAELANCLKQSIQQPPRLVVLASCQSAGDATAKGPGGALTALGPLLADAGVPAVIAMQGKVSMETVEHFMPCFFKELRRDGQIDRAMAVARGVARANVPKSDDWWMPVLFMRLKSGCVGQTLLPLEQPLKVATPALYNLPKPNTPFIGREEEIIAWGEVLRQPATRLLTLTGFGGLGKTRSALQLATLCAHDWVSEFPDGVCWIELADKRDSDGMLQHISNTLDFTIQPPATAREQIHGLLQGRSMLLVLDNLEQIPDAGTVISDMLTAAPGIKILATSRRALKLQGEELKEVPPLLPETAQQLFTARARSCQKDFMVNEENRAAIVELCRQLEGIPLAIELAASRIEVLEPFQILERLGKRFSLLKSKSPDLPERQRALRGTIDWSYELLTDDGKSLFAQLAVFHGGFTIDDIEAICDIFDSLESVAELDRHSLLRDASGNGARRHTMLEALRDYAVEKLDESPDGVSVRQKHAQHFLKIAREQMAKLRSPGEMKALSRLQVDYENAYSAQEWCRAAGEAAQAAEFSLLLGCFLQRRGFLREAVRQIESGLQITPPQSPDSEILNNLQLERAGLHLDACEEEAAQQILLQVLARCEQAGDARGQAAAHNLLGSARRDVQDAAGAGQHFATALEIYRQSGNDQGASMVLNNWGLTEDEVGERDAASLHLQEALALRRKLGDNRGVAETATNLGVQSQELERLEEAQKFYEEALNIEQALGDTFGVARGLSNLGEIAESRSELHAACRLFTAAVRLFEEAGSPHQKYCADLLQNVAPRAGLDDAALTQLRHDARGKSLNDVVAWALDKQLGT